MLRKITGSAQNHPIITLVVWLLVTAAGFGIGAGVFTRLTTTVGTVPGSESAVTKTVADQAGLEPPSITAVISGKPPAIQPMVRDLEAMPGIAKVNTSVSADAVLLNVELRPGKVAAAAAEARDRIRQVTSSKVVIAGGPLTENEIDDQAAADTQRAELIAAPALLVLLLLIFGSLIAAGLPLLVSVVGVAGTLGVLFGFSHFLDVSVSAIQVTTMLSVGLAVDYSLLMVNRFREERTGSGTVEDALTRACASAGRTVFFSGLTVSVSLAGLLAFQDPFLRSLGLAGASVVAIDMLAALTLVPALLALVGHRIRMRKQKAPATGGFALIARMVQRRPLVTMVVGTIVLVTLMAPAFGLRMSTSDPRSLPSSTQANQLYHSLAKSFPGLAGPNPITVVASVAPNDPALTTLSHQIAAVPGIARVTPGRSAEGLTLLNVTPVNATNTERSMSAVEKIRDLPAPFRVLVGGDSAQLLDYRTSIVERGPWGAGVVVVATFLLLFAFSGSILMPLKAVLTNLLSVGAALGVVVWVFQERHLASLLDVPALPGIDLTVPVLVATIAFGLSMDYELFLMSRIRERWLATGNSDLAVSEGLQSSGRIITAAALLLIVAFGGFLSAGFIPVKEVGLGLMVAVALDALVVRMLLVPATMTLLRSAAWWAPPLVRRIHTRVGVSEEPSAPSPVTVH